GARPPVPRTGATTSCWPTRWWRVWRPSCTPPPHHSDPSLTLARLASNLNRDETRCSARRGAGAARDAHSAPHRPPAQRVLRAERRPHAELRAQGSRREARPSAQQQARRPALASLSRNPGGPTHPVYQRVPTYVRRAPSLPMRRLPAGGEHAALLTQRANHARIGEGPRHAAIPGICTLA